MEWTQVKLPFPVYQQEPEEKCAVFFKRIQDSLQPSTLSTMIREDAVFWFLLGCREDIVTKIPFNPAVSNWIEPIELELNLEKIDRGDVLKGPFRACRLQECFNYYICNRCGHWGHRVNMCRNEKFKGQKGSRWKRKLDELKFSDDVQPRNKMRHTSNDEFRNEGNPPWKTMQQQNSSNH